MLGNRREMLAKIVMGNNVDNSVGNEQKEMRKIKENRLYGTGKWR